MLETKDLTKIYSNKKKSDVKAVDNVNIACDDGQIYSLLGPNGAGKTTCLRMFCTLINPTEGDVFINGLSVKNKAKEVRKHIGYVSYETKVDKYLTPREIASYFGFLNDVDSKIIKDRIKYFAELLDMNDFLDEQVRFLSTGMQQKTTILRALIHNPSILIFDEPTSGLDILTSKTITDYLKLLRGEGKCIIFSTHILWEAEKIADKIAIIHKGSIKAEGSLKELQTEFNLTELEDIFFVPKLRSAQ